MARVPWFALRWAATPSPLWDATGPGSPCCATPRTCLSTTLAWRSSVIRAVLLDLDDTLYPELDFVRSAMAAVAEAISARCGVAATSARAALDQALRTHGRGKTIDLALDALGVAHGAALIAELVAV